MSKYNPILQCPASVSVGETNPFSITGEGFDPALQYWLNVTDRIGTKIQELGSVISFQTTSYASAVGLVSIRVVGRRIGSSGSSKVIVETSTVAI